MYLAQTAIGDLLDLDTGLVHITKLTLHPVTPSTLITTVTFYVKRIAYQQTGK